MNKRLEILLSDQDLADIQQQAQRERLDFGEWVRRTLLEAREQKTQHDPQAKLEAIRHSASYAFPAADIEEMLREIEHGYQA